jgi:hypothetical protein
MFACEDTFAFQQAEADWLEPDELEDEDDA